MKTAKSYRDFTHLYPSFSRIYFVYFWLYAEVTWEVEPNYKVVTNVNVKPTKQTLINKIKKLKKMNVQ